MNADEACETLVCPELATVRAHCPGQTRRFCQGCADRAKGVAEAMGFQLTTEAIDLGEDLARQTLADDGRGRLVNTAAGQYTATIGRRAPYEPPAIERTIELDGTACRECGSDIGFCAPACSSQGRD